MISCSRQYTFIVGYVVSGTFRAGVVETFIFQNERLYVLSLEDDKDNEMRWLTAEGGICRKILYTFAIGEILERDGIKLENLEVIQDIEWKYLKTLSKKDEL